MAEPPNIEIPPPSPEDETFAQLARALVDYTRNDSHENYLAVGGAAAVARFTDNEALGLIERARVLGGKVHSDDALYRELFLFVSLLADQPAD